MGLIQNEHGVWIVRRRVPSRLQEAVARVLDQSKKRRAFLQKTLGTKDRKEATRLAPAVLVSFQKTLEEAEALLAERPVRTLLPQSDIDRIADFHFASRLAGDEEFTREGGGVDDEGLRSIAKQLDVRRIAEL